MEFEPKSKTFMFILLETFLGFLMKKIQSKQFLGPEILKSELMKKIYDQ